MHTLVTLLGAPRFNQDGSYEEATYLFEDGSELKTAYVGLALKEKFNPDQIVVLGTTASHWHSFVKFCLQDMKQDWKYYQELLANLETGHKNDKVESVDLDKASKLLSESDKSNCQYKLLLVPYGKNKKEQTETLHIMMQNFAEEDEVTIDVTYGLRHLPMLMQQSALLLQSIKNVKINNIFYGAFDLAKYNAGKSPIMVLDGLLEIDIWTKALYRYEQDGDYAAFREPLKASGAAEATLKSLDAAAYFERTFNLTKAGIELKKVKQALETTNQSGISSFFTGSLLKHISWSDSVSLQQRQANLAHFYLESGDFVRASIFAVESFITSLLRPQELKKQQDHDTRKDAKNSFYQDYKDKRQSDRGEIRLYPSFQELSKVRNALAHGTEADQRVIHLMVSQQEIETTLKRLFDELGIQKNYSTQA